MHFPFSHSWHTPSVPRVSCAWRNLQFSPLVFSYIAGCSRSSILLFHFDFRAFENRWPIIFLSTLQFNWSRPQAIFGIANFTMPISSGLRLYSCIVVNRSSYVVFRKCMIFVTMWFNCWLPLRTVNTLFIFGAYSWNSFNIPKFFLYFVAIRLLTFNLRKRSDLRHSPSTF